MTSRGPLQDAWPSLFRVVVGLYWLYFASQKWQGIGWMQPVLASAARVNPIPGLHELLVSVVVPNWVPFALAQSAGETVVAVLLILGLASRWAGVLGFLLAGGLALTVAFAVNDDGFRWLYYLAVLVNAQVIVSGPGAYALGRFGWVPAWLR
ncbi:MAG TPA: DoxX family membrane protein [Candidatus Limnocylindrales bacterium]|nr:DoxX family membrane protein [Candidatus Limnocylindrales bacterium]